MLPRVLLAAASIVALSSAQAASVDVDWISSDRALYAEYGGRTAFNRQVAFTAATRVEQAYFHGVLGIADHSLGPTGPQSYGWYRHGGTPRLAQAEGIWFNDTRRYFELSYAPDTHVVSYTLFKPGHGGRVSTSLLFDLDESSNLGFTDLVLRASAAGGRVSVRKLELDGLRLDERLSAGGHGWKKKNHGEDVDILQITRAELFDGFTLTGELRMGWGWKGHDPDNAFQIFALGPMTMSPIPVPAALVLFPLGGLALVALARRGRGSLRRVSRDRS